jgi:hypothetical protein
LVRPLGIVHRRKPSLSTAAKHFVELLLERDEPSARRNGDVGTYASGNGHGPKESARGRNGASRSDRKD